MTNNREQKMSHSIQIILSSSLSLFFLLRTAHSLPDPSHSDWGALSLTGLFIPSSTRLLTALPLWPRSAFSLSLCLALLSLWFSLSLSNPLNFSQSPLYASHYSCPPPSRCLAYFCPSLVSPVSVSLSCLTAQNQQPVKSTSCVNTTLTTPTKAAFSFELDEQIWHKQRTPCNPFTLPLLMYLAPSANHNALTWAWVSPQSKTNTYWILAHTNAFISYFLSVILLSGPCINFDRHFKWGNHLHVSNSTIFSLFI